MFDLLIYNVGSTSLVVRIYGKQYTSKTTDRFRYRWDNYKMKARRVRVVIVVIWKMLSKCFYLVTVCKMIIKVSLKMLRLD